MPCLGSKGGPNFYGSEGERITGRALGPEAQPQVGLGNRRPDWLRAVADFFESKNTKSLSLTRQIRESAAKWPGIRCEIRRILLAVPFVPIAGQEKLVASIARHATPIMGEDVKPHGVPIYTDARLYSTAGVPTVLYGAGPHTLLEANVHRADEKLKLDDLHRATRVVALALADLLGA